MGGFYVVPGTLCDGFSSSKVAKGRSGIADLSVWSYNTRWFVCLSVCLCSEKCNFFASYYGLVRNVSIFFFSSWFSYDPLLLVFVLVSEYSAKKRERNEIRGRKKEESSKIEKAAGVSRFIEQLPDLLRSAIPGRPFHNFRPSKSVVRSS